MAGYKDRSITFRTDSIAIRGYYFPWGTKRVRYDALCEVRRVEMSVLGGRGRI